MSDQDSVMISFQAPADRERFYDVLIMQDDLVCLKRDTVCCCEIFFHPGIASFVFSPWVGSVVSDLCAAD